MKRTKLLPWLLLWAVGTAPATTRPEDAYIQPVEGTRVGDVVQLESPTVLFVNKRCDLPLGNAQLMRFYASYQGKWITGCWAKNIHGEAVIVVPKQPTIKIPIDRLARAEVSLDGKARITALPPARSSQATREGRDAGDQAQARAEGNAGASLPPERAASQAASAAARPTR